jgi:hypothetical protein
VRIAGTRLVVERAKATVANLAIPGASLRTLAAAAGADLAAPLDVGPDAPPVGDADEPLALDAAAAGAAAEWFDLGWRALDEVLGSASSPSIIQLWPEHFDAGCDVAVGPGAGDRCNLGASPGDGPDGVPYLYVGPWQAARPGNGSFWNASFGATRGWDALFGAQDRAAAAVAFYREGLSLLAR